MDAARIGRSLRVLRLRKHLTQAQVAEMANLSRSLVAKIETGGAVGVRVRNLEHVARAVGASVNVTIGWQADMLDRLLDHPHAAMVERVVALLQALGWETWVEATFALNGERGSIDVLAWHPVFRALLVVEVKAWTGDSQATLAGVDRKARVAAGVAAQRGWTPRTVSTLLVIGDTRTMRRRIQRLDSTYRAAFPVRGRDVRGWLRNPGTGAIRGMLFLPYSTAGDAPRLRAAPRPRTDAQPRRAAGRPTAREAVGAVE